ncbi:MAG: TolC family protein [Nitrospirales bacterium]|nr:TolC family protein [Nitrospirales bacterium]
MTLHSPIHPLVTIGCLAATFLLCVIPDGWAQSTLPESSSFLEENDSSLHDLLPQDSVITLTLKEAVLQALEENLDIRVSRQTRGIRVTDIIFQQAQFDPTIELSGRYDRSIAPLNRPIFGLEGVTIGSEPDVLDQNDTRFSLTFKQKLLTGGSYDLNFDTNRNSVAGPNSFLFNPSYFSNLLFNLTQPLLKNFGPSVNKTQIVLARNAVAVEYFGFLNQVQTITAQIEKAYWELVFTRENLKVAKASLRAAEELLLGNRAKVKAGVMADVEALQAQAGVASRIEQVLLAQKAVQDQEDQLRQLLSPNEEQLTQTTPIVPLDTPQQQYEATNLSTAIQIAMKNRPDILQAKKNIESSGVQAQFAKNQLLPDLSFQGGVGLSGLGNSTSDTWDRLGSTDFYNMGGGLVLSYPLGNRSAQSQYQRRLQETRQNETLLQRVRQQVILDVKEAARRVQTNHKRIRTTQTARTLSERQLKAEQERLNLGLTTTRNVLEFQSDLAEAKGNELRAILDYNLALSNRRLVTATTFDHYDITVK